MQIKTGKKIFSFLAGSWAEMLRTFWRPNREVRATHPREVRAGPYLPVQLCHGTRRIKCRPKHETVWLNSSLSGLVYLFHGTVDVKELWNVSQWNGLLCWEMIVFIFLSSEVQKKFSGFRKLACSHGLMTSINRNWCVHLMISAAMWSHVDDPQSINRCFIECSLR